MRSAHMRPGPAVTETKAPDTERSDEMLVRSIAAGDRSAMQALFMRHNVRIYRFLVMLIGNTAIAEDLVGEVFLQVWRRADAFDQESEVSTWLLVMAHEKAQEALRPDGAQPSDSPSAVVVPLGNVRRTQHQGGNRMLRDCLARLSAVDREIIDLVYYHKKSTHEVSRIIGIPEAIVSARMLGARRRTEELLKAAGTESAELR